MHVRSGSCVLWARLAWIPVHIRAQKLLYFATCFCPCMVVVFVHMYVHVHIHVHVYARPNDPFPWMKILYYEAPFIRSCKAVTLYRPHVYGLKQRRGRGIPPTVKIAEPHYQLWCFITVLYCFSRTIANTCLGILYILPVHLTIIWHKVSWCV